MATASRQGSDSRLDKYNEMRDFKVTKEPKGKVSRSKTRHSFVIQKHDASHLHYDFRLEIDGVLKSWAIPKGPSVDPADKRLAMQTEDHPLAYGDFEGIIAEGEYGGGTVMLWDRGEWEPLSDDEQADLAKGHLKFKLHGKKLQGTWALVKLKNGGKKDNAWLLIKDKVDKGALKKIDDTHSVVSGKTLEQIEKTRARWKSTPKKSEKKTLVTEEVKASSKNKSFPSELSPMLCTLSDSVPNTKEWIHENKYDGYRLLVFCHNGKVKIRTRRGHDWSEKFPQLCEAFAPVAEVNGVFDGELVCLGKNGESDFQKLQNSIKDGTNCKSRYYVFDLPFYENQNLQNEPLLKRKELLKAVCETFLDEPVMYSPHVIGRGEDMWKKACDAGLEGVVSKLANSTYLPGTRSPSWLKTKCKKRQEFIVVGYTAPKGKRSKFGALLLGYYEGPKLQYAGMVGTGFSESSLASLAKQLEALKRKESPFGYSIREFLNSRKTTWVEPKLIAEVEFTGWTEGGRLRHPTFHGLREDKTAQEVVREEPPDGREKLDFTVLTHPEKILFQKEKISKHMLAEYYEAIAPLMLPHVLNRPLSLFRCPDGSKQECFFQKHVNSKTPAGVTGISIKDKGKGGKTLMIESAQGLIGLVQMGALEIHTWGAPAEHVETPDRVVFDLDPSEGVPWKRTVEAAFLIRDVLEGVHLKSFVKTTGGKGLHVVAPLTGNDSWETVKEFARSVAETLEAEDDLFTAKLRKAERVEKIFVDYLRNTRGATFVAPYSVRAREGAPVSVPLDWGELSAVSKLIISLKDILQSEEFQKNLAWRDFFKIKQSLW